MLVDNVDPIHIKASKMMTNKLCLQLASALWICAAGCDLSDRFKGSVKPGQDMSGSMSADMSGPIAGDMSKMGSSDMNGGSDMAMSNPPRDMALPAADMTTPYNIVFITSSQYVGTAIGGLSGADTICGNAATAGGLSGHFVALLSSSTVNAKDRLALNGVAARGWVGRDGKPFTDQFSALLPGNEIFYAIQLDESGHPVSLSDSVWTGTAGDGTAATTSASLCNDWQADANTNDEAIVGTPGGGPGYFSGAQGWPCSNSAHLYCFQVDYQNPVSVPSPPAGSKRIYLTQGLFQPGTSTPDAVCGMELPSGVSSAKAFISAPTAAAAMLAPTTTYVRPDGVVLGTGADFGAGTTPQSGIWVYSNGAYASGGLNSGVWTGSALPSVNGTSVTTCTNWTSTATSGGIHGNFSFLSTWWSRSGAGSTCQPTYSLYCVEQ